MSKIYIILLIILILILIAASVGVIMSRVEQAKYKVVEHDGPIEIRDYDPAIVAEVEVSGEREAAINAGFKTIADYIFGNNLSAKNVAMTAPVTQQTSEKIAMTAPVAQQNVGLKTWKVQFVMPSIYTLSTLPKPRNEKIKLKEIAIKRYAVVRFSGIANQKRLDLEQKKLQAFILEHHLTAISAPIYAFFNPPWTLPFLRRNEVMIEIKK